MAKTNVCRLTHPALWLRSKPGWRRYPLTRAWIIPPRTVREHVHLLGAPAGPVRIYETMHLPAVIHVFGSDLENSNMPAINNDAFWVSSQQGVVKAIPSGRWETTFGASSQLYGRAIILAATPCWYGLPFWQVLFNMTFADGDRAKTLRLCR